MNKLKTTLPIFNFYLLTFLLPLQAGTVARYSHETSSDYRHTNKFYGNLPGNLYGPRVAWAEPFVLGKLKLLIVLPIGAAREAVELQSRIPAEVSLITTMGHDNWAKPGAESAYDPVPSAQVLNDTANRLLSPAYRYDAIIIGKVQWKCIPPEIQRKIFEKVKAGAALIFISPWEMDESLQKEAAMSGVENPLADEVQASVPLGILPLDVDFEQGLPKHYAPRHVGPMEIRTGKLGGGTVVLLDYKDLYTRLNNQTVLVTDPWRHYAHTVSLTPFVADDELFYDYYFSILGKVLYHAAGKKTGVQIRPRKPVVSIGRKSLPAAPASFTLVSSNKELRDCSMAYELRDRRGRVLQKGAKEFSFRASEAALAPPIPALTQGTYIVDVWALQRGAILDWASAAVVVTDRQYIESVVPTKEFYPRKEPISGSVRLKTPVAKGLSLVVELWDSYDRLVEVVTPEPASGKFQLPVLQHPLSRA
ncbi:MAG: hypothetical protein HY318_15680, partial [Armatimonadetes bacterium]|nr:hypothetical protein [Armatimonadota bacterium]